MERTPDERLKTRSKRERVAFLFGLAAVVAAGWLRAHSTLARQLEDGPVWAAAAPPEPDAPTTLWRYDASRRDLRAVLVPAGTALEGGRPSRLDAARAIAGRFGAQNLRWLEGVEAPDCERGSRWGPSPSLLGRFAGGSGRPGSDLSSSDWLFAVLEGLALPPGERPVAELPVRSRGRGFAVDDALADRLGRRFLAPAPAEEAPATAEVLNGSGKDGLALTATQALRARGIDVLFYGGAPTPAPRTRIVDRDGDRRAAEKLRRALGLDAPIVTQLEPYPKAEATLILGADFPDSALR